jgi:hypothetical protein
MQEKKVGGQLSTPEPEPRSCWECGRESLVRLPDGGGYIDCIPTDWKWDACVANLLDTIETHFGLFRAQREKSRQAWGS